MSTVLFWTVIVPSVYLVGAVGTARVVFTRCYKREYPLWVEEKKRVAKKVADDKGRGYAYFPPDEMRARQHDAHWLTMRDYDVVAPTCWLAALWPVTTPYLLVIRPIGTVLVPLAVKWFTGPARKAVAS